jgi:hypothetical protein
MSEKQELQELHKLIRAEGEKLALEFHEAFASLLPGEGNQSLPPEVWQGIAAALADASGYTVTLESHVLTGNQMTGRRTVCVLEPTCFIELA